MDPLSQLNFKTSKELENYLLTKAQNDLARIFSENKFDFEANGQLIRDGFLMLKSMIADLSNIALGRQAELDQTMDKVIGIVTSNIMNKSNLVLKMNQLSSSTDQFEGQKKQLQRIKKEIAALEAKTIQDLSGITSAFLRTGKKTFQTANKIYLKGYDNDIEKIVKDREASMNLMRKYLIIAEKKGCTPDQVTHKDLKEYDEAELRRQEEELLASFDVNPRVKKKELKKGAKTAHKVSTKVKETFHEKTAVPKPSVQGTTASQKDEGKTQEFQKSPGKTKNATPQSKPSTQKHILQARTEFMLPLHQRSIIEAFRVIRWKESDPKVIREFTDRDNSGQEVKKYAHMKDEEIARQRAFHYLPGPEQLLGENYRAIYTFPTNTGRGVYASLFLNEKELSGFLYFGEGKKDQKVYHKYFEHKPYETKGFISLFSDRIEMEETEEENGNWESKRATFMTEMNEKGVIKITFIGELHYIKIYPIRKELLPEISFKDT